LRVVDVLAAGKTRLAVCVLGAVLDAAARVVDGLTACILLAINLCDTGIEFGYLAAVCLAGGVGGFIVCISKFTVVFDSAGVVS
jgi:hypothetical protein